MRKFFNFWRRLFSRRGKNKNSKAKKQKSESQHRIVESQINEPEDPKISKSDEDVQSDSQDHFSEKDDPVINKPTNICNTATNDNTNLSQKEANSKNQINADFDIEAIRTSILVNKIYKSKRDIRPLNQRPPNRQDRNSFISVDDSVTNFSTDIPEITIHDDEIVNSNSKEEQILIQNKQILAKELNDIKYLIKDSNSKNSEISKKDNNLTVNQILRNRISERNISKSIIDQNIESRKSLNFDDITVKKEDDLLSNNEINNQLKIENKKEKSTDCDSALIPRLCVHG